MLRHVGAFCRLLAFAVVVVDALKEQDRTSALLKGDFIIGTLFSVHHQPKQKQTEGNILSCGEVREMYGIQRIEATFQTVDRINRDPTLLANVTLGVEIRDSCWYAPVALQQSIEFIRDAISPAGAAVAGDTCSVQPAAAAVATPSAAGGRSSASFLGALSRAAPAPTRGATAGAVGAAEAARKAPLVGVIGPASSSVAIQVQNLLQLFGIPQIGYSTTSKDLSDKSRFHYFLRVVPSDYYQAQVMVDIVRRNNWTYVSAVNTDENYGQSGIQAFRELAEKANICIAKEDSVLSNAEDEVFEAVLKKLDEDKNARVVVCFCEGMTVRGLLRATKALDLTGRFLIIGSDGWADRSDVTEGYEREARGSISIRIHSPYVTSFDDYYFRLDPFSNARNPWFREFWQVRFNCTLPPDAADADADATLNLTASGVATPDTTTSGPTTPGPGAGGLCTGRERLSERYKQDPKLSFVIKAIYTMAYGLHNLLQDVCGPGAVGVCPEVFPFNGSLFKSYLLNVTFTYGNDQELVEFDRRGDPPGRYNIMNYQLLPNGTYDYIHVGDWHNGTLNIWEELQYAELAGGKVESVCSRPCPLGSYKNLQTGGQEQKCCWVCVPCNNNAILVDELTCEPCESGYWPNDNKTACIKITVEFVQWTDTEAVVAMTFSCLGFISTFFAGAVFMKYNDTPVVKSSTRELSYLILAGMTMSHAATFPILAQPSWLTCSLSRLLPGLSFAMIYASLLTKTNRIARILAGSKKRFPTRKPRFMSATSQVCITSSLIAVEAGIAGAMLALEPAAPTLQFPTLDRVVLACNTSPLGVVAPLAADFLLVLLCTVYAVKTRNVPENFNEAKFIGFAMYTTCVIWIAFVPIYFGSDSKIITMCMCVTLSAMVTLVFLFLPKIYIILVRPERNNRALFTTSKIRCHIGSRVASAISNKSSNSYSSCADSPRDRLVALKKNEANNHGVAARPRGAGGGGAGGAQGDVEGRRVGFPAQPPTWRSHGEPDTSLIFPGLLAVPAERLQVESRTLSCQTGTELLQRLIKSHARKMNAVACKEKTCAAADSGWAQLSPRALLAAQPAKCQTAHIREEDVSELSGEEDSGKLKNITISLGSCECRSQTRSESDGSSSPDAWSNNSTSAV